MASIRRELTYNARGRNARARQSMQRVIIKQGYLKKLPNSQKFGSVFKKPERRWFIFGVMSNTEPYLEYFDSEESIFTGSPLGAYYLDTCRNVIKGQRTTRYSHVFSLVLGTRQLSLIAPNRETMMEWCRAIENKLVNLGILGSVDGSNNYVTIPRTNRRSMVSSSTRPTNTEYLTPASLDEEYRLRRLSALIDRSPPPVDNPAYNYNGNAADRRMTFHQISAEEEFELERSCTSMPARISTQPVYMNQNEHQNGSSTTLCDSPDVNQNLVDVNEEHDNASDYETPQNRPEPRQDRPYQNIPDTRPLLQGQPPTEQGGGTDTTVSDSQSPQRLPSLPSYTESISTPATPVIPSPGYDEDHLSPRLTSDLMSGPDSPPAADEEHAVEHPPPYVSRRLLTVGANMPLKLQQVAAMREEMASRDGIGVLIDRRDCRHALGLIDYLGSVWIVGWNQRSYPYMQSILHIGDELLSVNDTPAKDALSAKALIKNCTDKMDAHLKIRRTPHAKVFVFERTDEPLGLEFVAGTAEVSYVDPNGLAARNGMPPQAVFNRNGPERCNWWITEVNRQPLNLFYSQSQVKHHLNAKGAHLSIVIQPAKIIKAFKRQFKSSKFFKDYIVL